MHVGPEKPAALALDPKISLTERFGQVILLPYRP
jgi:hypothetical protein